MTKRLPQMHTVAECNREKESVAENAKCIKIKCASFGNHHLTKLLIIDSLHYNAFIWRPYHKITPQHLSYKQLWLKYWCFLFNCSFPMFSSKQKEGTSTAAMEKVLFKQTKGHFTSRQPVSCPTSLTESGVAASQGIAGFTKSPHLLTFRMTPFSSWCLM